MNNVERYIKPNVRAMSGYRLESVSYQIKLNQNENPYDIPPELKQEILDVFKKEAWNRYPDFTGEKLREKLAAYLDVRSENVIVGNGSNEMLKLIALATLGPGKNFLLVAPTFLIYEHLGHTTGAHLIDLEFNHDWSFPVHEILNTLQTTEVPLTILCSPNSPTGTILPPEDLEKILKNSKGLVVLDEAYYEFACVPYLKLWRDHENLILVRTFSKALGIAGLRTGYLIAHPQITQELMKVKLPYNLNKFSELAAIKILEHPEIIQNAIKKILQERDRLGEALQELDGIRVYPSHANFFMMEPVKISASDLFEQLLAHGILIRDISRYHPRLKNKLRVSVGTPTENTRFLQTLKKILEQ